VGIRQSKKPVVGYRDRGEWLRVHPIRRKRDASGHRRRRPAPRIALDACAAKLQSKSTLDDRRRRRRTVPNHIAFRPMHRCAGCLARTEWAGNCGGRSKNMPRNFASRWSQMLRPGIGIGITGTGTTTVRPEGKKVPTTRVRRMPAHTFDALMPDTRVNTIPTSRALSSKAITMATTAVEAISAKCSRPRNRVTTRATALGAKIIRREGTRITRATRIVLTMALSAYFRRGYEDGFSSQTMVAGVDAPS
jgi:hypothetical protein